MSEVGGEGKKAVFWIRITDVEGLTVDESPALNNDLT